MQYLENQDPDAAKQLVTSNLRLVVKLAFQYHRQWSNVLDLIQEGNMGLVEALSRYDPYRGIRFSSYAQYWIRAMILRYLMDNYRMVRLGSTRHGRKLFFQLNKEKKRLEAMGIKPTSRAPPKHSRCPRKRSSTSTNTCAHRRCRFTRPSAAKKVAVSESSLTRWILARRLRLLGVSSAHRLPSN